MEDIYTRLRNLIEIAGDIVDFAPYGEGDDIPNEWILNAEKMIGVPLPPSYKWWIQKYNGGEIYGDEVLSLYDPEKQVYHPGDIACKYNNNQKLNLYPGHHLLILDSDEEYVYFDLSKKNRDGEYLIYHRRSGYDPVLYAKSFAEFLIKWIQRYMN